MSSSWISCFHSNWLWPQAFFWPVVGVKFYSIPSSLSVWVNGAKSKRSGTRGTYLNTMIKCWKHEWPEYTGLLVVNDMVEVTPVNFAVTQCSVLCGVKEFLGGTTWVGGCGGVWPNSGYLSQRPHNSPSCFQLDSNYKWCHSFLHWVWATRVCDHTLSLSPPMSFTL